VKNVLAIWNVDTRRVAVSAIAWLDEVIQSRKPPL
jgi:hypothetical protein